MTEAFTWGSGGERVSGSERRRRIAEAMMKSGSDMSPVQHWTQGAARVAQALLGGMQLRDADAADKAGQSAVTGDVVLASSAPAASSYSPASASGGKVDIGPVSLPATPAALAPVFTTKEAEFKLPTNYLPQVANIESRFDPNAANPKSSARGLFQFTKGTARDYGLANPMDPIASTDAAARLAADNTKTLTRALGRAPTAGELYLAHQQGGGGASKLLANPDARAVDIVGRRAVLDNGGHEGMRAGDFARLWTRKVASNEADVPAAGAATAGAETGTEGFFIPPGPAGEGLPIMQPGGALPNFDPATGRWNGPSTPPALATAPTPVSEPAEPAAVAPEAPAPLPPVFMSEGVGQPWMGSAIMPAPPAPQMAATPLPPSRPADLALADVPAPGARVAQAMVTPALPAPLEIDPNSNDGGSRAFAASGGGANVPVGDNATVFDRIVAAMGGRPAPAAAAPSPGVARVAAAMPASAPAPAAEPSPGVARVAAAMPESNPQLAAAQRILNSPHANAGQRAIAQAVIERTIKGADMETFTRPDGSVWRAPKTGGGAPVQVFGPQSKPAEPGSQVQVFRDEKTGEIVAVDKTKVGAGAGSDVVRPGKPRPDDNMDAEGKLRNEFSGRVKEFVTVQDAYGRIVASVQNRIANPQEKSPASDIALVFGYMKMLDPGSVVREGEYATAQNAAGIPERVRNYYNKAIDGEFLDPKQRDDMVATAGRLYKQARGQASAEGKRYRDLATSYGLNPDRIVALPDEIVIPKTAVAPPPAAGAPGVPTPPAAPAPPMPPAPKSQADYDALPRGSIYLDPQGRQRTKP